jgi:hypothetical protein
MALKSTDRRVDELEINKQDALVSAENIRTINGESLLGDGDIAVQQTLVSGTNIKTINGNSLLGSGDIVITPSSSITVGTTPITSGVDGRVLFQSGGVVSQDSGFTWDNTNKRLGVGTSTPQARLDVRAQGALSTDIAFRVRNSANTLDLLSVNGLGVLTAAADAVVNGVNVGRGGGGIVSNARLGTNALQFNTTGSTNTAVGGDALRLNTTGSQSTAVGYFALYSNNGNLNTAVGRNAMFSNTTGGASVGIGANALSNNTTGGNNVGIGNSASRYIADGTTNLTIANNSVFLGASTKALADNQTNQIVIGHNAIGAGSNTATLGNTSIVKTILRGTINAAGLPTSPAGLVTGDIWNNLGILTIV